MKFNPQVVKDNLFTGDMVMSEWWGGDRDFEYVHDKYWPALVSMCESRNKSWLEKWRALGGTVGIKEWEYKGGATAQVLSDKTQLVESEKVAEIPAPEAIAPEVAAA
jgi:hypothetical protein